MQIAILSDIHGNILALDAVLADATTEVKFIRGNMDRYVCSGAVNRFNAAGDAPDFNSASASSWPWLYYQPAPRPKATNWR